MSGGLTKFSALAVAAVAIVAVLALALAFLGPGGERATAASTPALFDQEVVQDIYRRISPAVVKIRADRSLGPNYSPIAVGSGFLIDRQGHVATNNHVIIGADRILLEFEAGFTLQAQVIGISLANDLALLKVDPALLANINPAEFGDSSAVRPGQLAVAIGNPFGLSRSISVGIIAGVDRTLGSNVGRPIHGVLQTDAVTNPGDSGGPLIDRDGRVIGMNTSRLAGPVNEDGRYGSQRIGFALPANTLARLLPTLREEKVIEAGLLGIAGIPMSARVAERLGLPVRTGIYVTRVLADSPAGRAGIVPAGPGRRGLPAGGDVIAAVDGVPVTRLAGFFAELDKHAPGEQITLSVVRKGVEEKVLIALDRWPVGENPFTTSPDVDPRKLAGTASTPYPFVPPLPGFPFPDLYPENP